MDDAKLREKAMMAVVAVVVLYAVAVGVWFFSAESAWKRAAKAYGRECCMRGMPAYYIKARELSDKLAKAVRLGNEASVMAQLIRPACLIIDEIGRCRFDRACTDLLFHVVDSRGEKNGPNLVLMTSNFTADKWDECFTGGSTLLCTLDRLFDEATVFMIKGSSFRGQGLETYSVEAVPTVSKLATRG